MKRYLLFTFFLISQLYSSTDTGTLQREVWSDVTFGEVQAGVDSIQCQTLGAATTDSTDDRKFTIMSTELPDMSEGVHYSQPLHVTWGVSPFEWSVSGEMPDGMSIVVAEQTVGKPAVGGRLQGVPTESGTYTFTLNVSDSLGSQASQVITLKSHMAGDISWQNHQWQEWVGQEQPWQEWYGQKHQWQQWPGQQQPWQDWPGQSYPLEEWQEITSVATVPTTSGSQSPEESLDDSMDEDLIPQEKESRYVEVNNTFSVTDLGSSTLSILHLTTQNPGVFYVQAQGVSNSDDFVLYVNSNAQQAFEMVRIPMQNSGWNKSAETNSYLWLNAGENIVTLSSSGSGTVEQLLLTRGQRENVVVEDNDSDQTETVVENQEDNASDQTETVVENQEDNASDQTETIVENQEDNASDQTETVVENQEDNTSDQTETVVENQEDNASDQTETVVENQEDNTSDQTETVVEQDTSKQNYGDTNYLYVKGNQLCDSAGQPVRLTGINWFGFETSTGYPHGLWERGVSGMLQQIKDLNFNCIRIPWSNAILAPGASLSGINIYGNDSYTGEPKDQIVSTFETPLELLDYMIDLCQELDLKVILDNHSREPDGYLVEGLWYTDSVSEEQWIADWVFMADRYKDHDSVIAMDINNEPHFTASWGTNSPATDWNQAAERCGNAILGANPNVLIMVEGIENFEGDSYWWGGNLQGAKKYPITLTHSDKLVYSPHEYGPSVYQQPFFSSPDFPQNMSRLWYRNFDYLYQEQTSPLFVGEFGAKTYVDTEKVWIDRFMSYMGNRYSWTYWSLNPNSGDTGGMLDDDWITLVDWRYNLIKPYLAPEIPNGRVGKPDVRNNAPQAVLEISNITSTTLSFDASASTAATGGSLQYEWHFGDGEVSTEVNPTHTFTRPGFYPVTLLVTTSEGQTDVAVEPLEIALNTSCAFGVPSEKGLPTLQETYSFMHSFGREPINIPDFQSFEISWDDTQNILYGLTLIKGGDRIQLSNNAIVELGQFSPALTLVEGANLGLAGKYYVDFADGNFVMVKEDGSSTLYFSNEATSPECESGASSQQSDVIVSTVPSSTETPVSQEPEEVVQEEVVQEEIVLVDPVVDDFTMPESETVEQEESVTEQVDTTEVVSGSSDIDVSIQEREVENAVIPEGQTGEYNYAEVLQKSLLFYEAQQSGELPETNRVSWRGDSALEDGQDVGMDLTGGWYDAGDHVKFGFPMAASSTMLAWGGLEFPQGYKASGQEEHLLENLRWVCDYFLKCHVRDSRGETSAFYGQVGNGAIDHSWWGPVEVYPMERPAYKVDVANPGSDLTGETAAALASAAMLFNESDPEYASELLENAITLYTFAETYLGKYTDAITDATTYYNSWSGYKDELMWGALWLYRATGEQSYLDKAEAIHDEMFSVSPQNVPNLEWTQNWDDKIFGSLVLLAEETGKEVYKANVEKWLNYWLPNGGVTYTPGGLAWLSEWGPLRYAANTSLLAFIYAKNVSDPGGAYSEFAQSQINYMLGDNPSNRSYVCGFGNDFPRNPHHRTAHGNWNNNIQDSANNRHILYGALVGGPDDTDQYEDDRSNYYTNEVTTDYNAGFTGAIARMYELHGGSPLRTFPPVEEVEPELYVSAQITQQNSTYTEVRAWLNNKSAWPARNGEGLSVRYYLDLSELYENGFSVDDVTVNSNFIEGGVISKALVPAESGSHMYYTEVDFSETNVVPGGSMTWRREMQIRWTVSTAAAQHWDITNDPSLRELSTDNGVDLNSTISLSIPTYQYGVLVKAGR